MDTESATPGPSDAVQLDPPSMLDRLFHMPLYERLKLPAEEQVANGLVKDVRTTARKFDAYCPDCTKPTTWTVVVDKAMRERLESEKTAAPVMGAGRAGIPPSKAATYLEDFQLRAACSRDGWHQVKLFFTMGGPDARSLVMHRLNHTANTVPWEVIKIGQTPSLTDFQLGDLAEFEEGLSKAQRREFVRAINTSAHGFNVAACVYYRRVFEGILLEARDEHMKRAGLDQWPEFNEARGVDERIRLLRDSLPAFMSEHPHLYGILSLGVHELTEEQCAEELPMLRKAIELIVSDRVAAARAKKDRQALSRLLAQSVDKHKGR